MTPFVATIGMHRPGRGQTVRCIRMGCETGHLRRDGDLPKLLRARPSPSRGAASAPGSRPVYGWCLGFRSRRFRSARPPFSRMASSLDWAVGPPTTDSGSWVRQRLVPAAVIRALRVSERSLRPRHRCLLSTQQPLQWASEPRLALRTQLGRLGALGRQVVAVDRDHRLDGRRAGDARAVGRGGGPAPVGERRRRAYRLCNCRGLRGAGYQRTGGSLELQRLDQCTIFDHPRPGQTPRG